MPEPKRIFVCSPLKADTPEGILRNIDYAEQCCAAVYEAGFDVYAPHVFYTRFLDDNVPEHRRRAMESGLRELKRSDELWFFIPPWAKTSSSGMLAEQEFARAHGIPVHFGPLALADVATTHRGDIIPFPEKEKAA